MKPRYKLMLEKSISAMLSAIEIYNKPDFKYREETFSVLCINSWELLLKAKILNLSSNKLSSLYIKERRTLKSGEKSKRQTIKKTHSGNPMSVNIMQAYKIITEEYGEVVDSEVKDNLISLIEIRNNSIHFVNDDLLISLKVQQLGSASLQNYLQLVSQWFGDMLSEYNFYLMPLSFFRTFDTAAGVVLNKSENRVLNYIKSIEEKYDNKEIGDYNLTLNIDLNFKKVKSNSSIPVQYSNDKNALKVTLTEEDVISKYPWTYEVLTNQLKKRYKDFKQNKKYHDTRKKLEDNEKLSHTRLMNPRNPDSGKKVFYNPNILKEFDKVYTKK